MIPRSGPLLPALLVGCALLSCAAPPPDRAVVAPSPRPSAAAAPEADHRTRYPEADAIVLSELLDVELRIDQNLSSVYRIETRQVRKKLLKNLEEHAEVEFVLYAGSELVELSARTIRPSGTAIELESSDVHRMTGYRDRTISFADFETYWLTFPGIERDCVVEYEYTVRVDHPFAGGDWNVQGDVPKVITVFRIAIPVTLLRDSGWTWRYQLYNAPFLGSPRQLDRDVAEETSTRRKIVYEWAARDVPAFESEPLMPPSRQYRSRVEFGPGTWKNWKDPASSYAKLFFRPEVGRDRNEIARLAQEIAGDAADDEERIRRVHDYLGTIRYVAIALNDGGLRPSPPAQVVNRSYGDCKDKSTLMIALLGALDVPAYPALVRTSPSGRLDPDFVTFSFDHMIVKVEPDGGESGWIDPTATFCPFGRLPWAVQGVDALVLHDELGGVLERTPQDAMEDNGVDVSVYLEIVPDGSARARAEIRRRGMNALRSRGFYYDQTVEELTEHCEDLLTPTWQNVEVRSPRVTNLEELDEELVLKFDFEIPRAVRLQGDLVFLDPEAVRVFDWLPEDLDPERQYPLEFPYADETSLEVVVKLPTGWRARNLPRDVHIESGQMEFRRESWERTDDHVVYQAVLQHSDAYTPLEDWPAAHRFFGQVAKLRDDEIILAESP